MTLFEQFICTAIIFEFWGFDEDGDFYLLEEDIQNINRLCDLLLAGKSYKQLGENEFLKTTSKERTK